jgi:hypothetical protein
LPTDFRCQIVAQSLAAIVDKIRRFSRFKEQESKDAPHRLTTFTILEVRLPACECKSRQDYMSETMAKDALVSGF